MNNARFRRLRARVKSYLDFTDFEVMKWWVTPIEAFDFKTPSEMAANSESFKAMEDIISHSNKDISGGLRARSDVKIEEESPQESSVGEEFL